MYVYHVVDEESITQLFLLLARESNALRAVIGGIV
jgi:hypothetical protein